MIVFKGLLEELSKFTNYIHTSNCELNDMPVMHSKENLGIT